MENPKKTAWKDGFKEKLKKSEKDEYWLKDYIPVSEPSKQEGMKTGVLDLMELERMKTIEQMEMENYKHVELLQNISDLKENLNSVIEGGYHKKKEPTATTNSIHKWHDDEYGDLGNSGDGENGENEGYETENNDEQNDNMDNDNDNGENAEVDGFGNIGKENYSNRMKKCKKKLGSGFSDLSKNYYLYYIYKIVNYLVKLLDSNGNKLNNLYILISDTIADFLSGNTATKSDKKFIYNYFCNFIVILMSIFVFMKFYFLFAFDETWKVPEKYDAKKAYFNDKLKGNSAIDAIIGVAIDSFMFIMITFHWLLSYVPRNYLSIKNHMLLPYLFWFILIFVSGIHEGLFSFLKSLIMVDYKKISKYTIYTFITILCVYFTAKKIVLLLKDHPILIPKDMITFLFFLFVVVVFFIIMMMTQPVVAYFLCGCYLLYYLFMPIGFFSKIGKVYETLTELNYEYIDELEYGKCMPGIHPCKDIGILQQIYVYMIEPAHLFVIRHFLSFIFTFFLLKLMIDANFYVKSVQLKTLLMFLCFIISLLLMIAGGWFKSMIVSYDDGKGFFESYFHLGLLPLIGLIYFYMLF